MFKNFSPRLFFTMAAIALLVVVPFFAIFTPLVIIETLFTDDTKLYVYPFMTSAKLIVLAFILFAGACLLLGWQRKTITYVGSIIFVLAGFVTLYSTTQIYAFIDSEQIYMKSLLSEESMEWADIREVVFEYVPGDLGNYVFHGADGHKLVLKEDKSHVTSEIYKLANTYNIPFIEKEKQ